MGGVKSVRSLYKITDSYIALFKIAVYLVPLPVERCTRSENSGNEAVSQNCWEIIFADMFDAESMDFYCTPRGPPVQGSC